jgi:hypothetical protein
LSLDVHQFSIITELLGTPPDDVISTICSENVRAKQGIAKAIGGKCQGRVNSHNIILSIDFTIRQEPSQT